MGNSRRMVRVLVFLMTLLFLADASASPPVGVNATNATTNTTVGGLADVARAGEVSAGNATDEKTIVRSASEKIGVIFDSLEKSLRQKTGRQKGSAKKELKTGFVKASRVSAVSAEVSKVSGKHSESQAMTGSVPDVLHVWPESKSYVQVSKVDTNRFVCERGKVVGEIYSNDKGLVVKRAGDSLYLRIQPKSFAFEHPFEFFVVCGDDDYRQTYTMILRGERISTRTVVLHSSESRDKMNFLARKPGLMQSPVLSRVPSGRHFRRILISGVPLSRLTVLLLE